jgi:hypothetical protein
MLNSGTTFPFTLLKGVFRCGQPGYEAKQPFKQLGDVVRPLQPNPGVHEVFLTYFQAHHFLSRTISTSEKMDMIKGQQTDNEPEEVMIQLTKAMIREKGKHADKQSNNPPDLLTYRLVPALGQELHPGMSLTSATSRHRSLEVSLHPRVQEYPHQLTPIVGGVLCRAACCPDLGRELSHSKAKLLTSHIENDLLWQLFEPVHAPAPDEAAQKSLNEAARNPKSHTRASPCLCKSFHSRSQFNGIFECVNTTFQQGHRQTLAGIQRGCLRDSDRSGLRSDQHLSTVPHLNGTRRRSLDKLYAVMCTISASSWLLSTTRVPSCRGCLVYQGTSFLLIAVPPSLIREKGGPRAVSAISSDPKS